MLCRVFRELSLTSLNLSLSMEKLKKRRNFFEKYREAKADIVGVERVVETGNQRYKIWRFLVVSA